jgi:hypothetical protein
MNRVVALLLCGIGLGVGLPAAAENPVAVPHWSFELKGGRFYPDLPDWKRYYGSDSMNQFAMALSYMPVRALELGTELGRAHDVGEGLLPTSGLLGGEVTYIVMPVHIYLVARGVFSERQWLIPYAGGGWSRAYYKQTVAYQQEHSGHADGWNARAGLLLLLNPLDPGSAESLRLDYGIEYTYFTLEAQKYGADKDGTELGGESYMLGLRFDY